MATGNMSISLQPTEVKKRVKERNKEGKKEKNEIPPPP
jgi:hypothetical protein